MKKKPYRPYKRLAILDNKVHCVRESRIVNVRRCGYCGNRIGGGQKQIFCNYGVIGKTFRERINHLCL